MSIARLARALEGLRDLLQTSRALELLEPFGLFSAAERPSPESVMGCFARLSIAYANMSLVERDLVNALGLQPLVETGWWTALIQAISRSAVPEAVAADVAAMCARIHVLEGGLPAIADLLAQSRPPPPPGHEEIELLMSEEAGPAPSLPQLSDALGGVQQLWSVLQDLAGGNAPLRLVACEPDSRAALVLSGPRLGVQELKTVLASALEQSARIVAAEAEQRASAAARNTPLLDRIARSGRADGTALRAAAEEGVRRFLLAGCNLPAEDAAAGPAAPEPAVPNTPPRADVADGGAALQDLILEERRQLAEARGRRRATPSE